ncbi:LysR substrate-binding domain-containing protein [Subtercola lobariae]|uniref:LysR substrate-binding domain-containing protein n=1 Tax=Subtercola lobariae TaxID=1588641 RepID=A0A917B5Y9_9MICO|nr:LysR substrate-binding domain-containing protein [Subtercola lobariae]GGF21184.1 hypothetical protein GCM10011399_13560 [Subtercola lobariae]
MNADHQFEPHDLDRLADLATTFSGSLEGDAVVTAVKALRRMLGHPTAAPMPPAHTSIPFTIHAPAGIPAAAIAERFAAEHPHLDVTVVESEHAAQAVRRGAASAGFVRLPAQTRGLALMPALTEPFVVAVAQTDALAGRSSVAIDELAERHLLHNPDEVPEWRDVSTELLGPTVRTSKSFALGPLTMLDEQLDHVAAGNGIIIVPLSRATSSGRNDVNFITVDGVSADWVIVSPQPNDTASPEAPTSPQGTADEFARLAAALLAS